MKVYTRGYGGREIRETVKIQTNDRQQPGLSVTLRGRVEKFARITPSRVILTGKAGTELKTEIRIVPGEEFPFQITKVEAVTGTFIELGLEEIRSSGKRSYLLTVENRKSEKGRYYDQIHLETDHPESPVIRIPVMGNIQ